MKVNEDGLLDGIHPLAFVAKANAEDTPNYGEAVYGPDSAGFIKAMETESADRKKYVDDIKLKVETDQYTMNAETTAEKIVGSIMNEVG